VSAIFFFEKLVHVKKLGEICLNILYFKKTLTNAFQKLFWHKQMKFISEKLFLGKSGSHLR
jgi:hypothetical protein